MFANATTARTKNNHHENDLIDLLRSPRPSQPEEFDDGFFNIKKEIPGGDNKDNTQSAAPGKDLSSDETRHTVVSNTESTVDLTGGDTSIIGTNNNKSDHIEVSTAQNGDMTIKGGNQNTISPDKFAQLANKFESGGGRNGHRHNNHRTQ